MGPLSALDTAVELGGTWRQYEELQITPLAGGVRALRAAFPGGDGTPGRFDEEAAPLQVREDASHHGGGDMPTGPTEKDPQLVLPPAVLHPQLQDGLDKFAAPGRAAAPLGRSRPVLQTTGAGPPPAAAAAVDGGPG